MGRLISGRDVFSDGNVDDFFVDVDFVGLSILALTSADDDVGRVFDLP